MFFAQFLWKRWRQKTVQNMSHLAEPTKFVTQTTSMSNNISWTLRCEERIRPIRKAGFAPNHIFIAWWLLIWSNKIGYRYLITWRIRIRGRSWMKTWSLQCTWAFYVTWVIWCIWFRNWNFRLRLSLSLLTEVVRLSSSPTASRNLSKSFILIDLIIFWAKQWQV